jgi:AcrR family transcriptional regulator
VLLVEAAEALFAERGIAAVSLNEVRLAAGQSNVAAVNYHFGSKERLLRAILEHRVGRIEADRAKLLRELDEQGRTAEPRALLAALIQPQARSIERGEPYIGLVAQLVSGENGWLNEYTHLLADPELTPAAHRVHELLRARLDRLPRAVADRRLVFLYTSAFRALAEHQREKAARRAPSTRRYVAELLDALVAILDVPASPETLALHRKRARA